MKISELKDPPRWLLVARTANEDVEIVDGTVVWHSGDWCGGDWRGGDWHSGVWHGGVWHSGDWYDGVWRDGEWHGGDWCGGDWRGGDWHSGNWCGGKWHGGIWHGGVWHGGDWCNGVWRGGVWRGSEDRLRYMLSLLGCVGEEFVAYHTTQIDGMGRYNADFTQPEGEYYETNLPPAGAGTCVRGIHVTTAARAWTYFGVDPKCQFWEVRVKREDVLDCDGDKIRIRGGVFKKIPHPF